MHDDEIGQKIGGLLVDAPMEQARQDDRVAEATDREEFGHPLQDGHDNGLQCRHDE